MVANLETRNPRSLYTCTVDPSELVALLKEAAAVLGANNFALSAAEDAAMKLAKRVEELERRPTTQTANSALE
jgi:hypothetical protein